MIWGAPRRASVAGVAWKLSAAGPSVGMLGDVQRARGRLDVPKNAPVVSVSINYFFRGSSIRQFDKETTSFVLLIRTDKVEIGR